MGAASFWRGAWYILDDHLFPDHAASSAAASFGLGVVGMTASQGLIAKCEDYAKGRSIAWLKFARFGALYTIAVSCVLVWRGTWIGWDILYEALQQYQLPQGKLQDEPQLQPAVTSCATDPGHRTKSGVASHVLAISVLVGSGLFASVLAPPAATGIIRDFAVQATSAGGQRMQSVVAGPAGNLISQLWPAVRCCSCHLQNSFTRR